jgi:hypothetical protein
LANPNPDLDHCSTTPIFVVVQTCAAQYTHTFACLSCSKISSEPPPPPVPVQPPTALLEPSSSIPLCSIPNLQECSEPEQAPALLHILFSPSRCEPCCGFRIKHPSIRNFHRQISALPS